MKVMPIEEAEAVGAWDEETPLRRGDQKKFAYAAMREAYAEVSFDGEEEAFARNVMYAVRRISRLGDRLSAVHFLTGFPDGGLIDQFLRDFPELTADWDIVRDERGTFREPHTGKEVGLGTIGVRDYIEDMDRNSERQFTEDHAPMLGLGPWTDGPLNRYGAVLYIEKEGFEPAIRRGRIQERFDLGIISAKGKSNRASRRLAREVHDEFGLPVYIARDFDNAGFQIAGTLGEGFTDLGLRLQDIEDLPDLQLRSESDTFETGRPLKPYDPRPNLRRRGATDEEIAFLCDTAEPGVEYSGRRVELNALVGQQFIDWLEQKLTDAGIAKVVPDPNTMKMAWETAQRRERINRAVRKAYDATTPDRDGTVPADLHIRMSRAMRLKRNQNRPWDDVLVDLAAAALPDEDDEL